MLRSTFGRLNQLARLANGTGMGPTASQRIGQRCKLHASETAGNEARISMAHGRSYPKLILGRPIQYSHSSVNLTNDGLLFKRSKLLIC